MAFEISSVAVKDGAGASVGGGILAADVAGGGVGPFFFFHGLVDGVAGVNKVAIDASNRMAVLADLGATDNAVLDAIAASLATLDNVVAGNEAQVDILTIAAGDNNIGNVDIVTVPADPFGANADAASATGSISAKLRAIAATGIPITSLVPGTAATNLGKAVGSAAGATDTGVAILAVRDDALSALSDPESDYVPLRVNSTGALHVAGTVDLGATDNAVLDSILTAAEAIQTAVTATLNVSDADVLAAIEGTVAHGDTNTSNPALIGGEAIAHGANPTAVAAGALSKIYTNRAGIPFFIGGHPNIISRSHLITDANGAQTDVKLVTVSDSPSTKIVVTRLAVKTHPSNTGPIAIRVGFGTTNVPTPTLAGTNGLLIDGVYGPTGLAGENAGNATGIVGVGGNGEDLVLTCEDPVGGNAYVTYSYYTIES